VLRRLSGNKREINGLQLQHTIVNLRN
jgi:hypothetical protein